MDPTLRWLRRHVLTRAAERAAVETVMAGTAVGAALVWLGAEPVGAAAVAVPAGPMLIALRLVVALATNPVDHRYLSSWTDPADHLEVVPRSRSDGPNDDRAEIDGLGFRFVMGLARADEPAGPDGHLDGARDQVDLHRGGGGRVLLGRDRAGEVTLVSRLADGRLLVTSGALVPPRSELVVNQVARGPVDHLVAAHGHRLIELATAGIDAMPVWPEAMVELLRLEWDAWHRLGPLVGPLVAVERRRRVSARFEIRVDPEAIWARGRPTAAALDRSGPGLPKLAGTERPVAAASTPVGR